MDGGWIWIKNMKKIDGWLDGYIKIYEKNMDGWMDKKQMEKNGWMDGWIEKN